MALRQPAGQPGRLSVAQTCPCRVQNPAPALACTHTSAAQEAEAAGSQVLATHSKSCRLTIHDNKPATVQLCIQRYQHSFQVLNSAARLTIRKGSAHHVNTQCVRHRCRYCLKRLRQPAPQNKAETCRAQCTTHMTKVLHCSYMVWTTTAGGPCKMTAPDTSQLSFAEHRLFRPIFTCALVSARLPHYLTVPSSLHQVAYGSPLLAAARAPATPGLPAVAPWNVPHRLFL